MGLADNLETMIPNHYKNGFSVEKFIEGNLLSCPVCRAQNFRINSTEIEHIQDILCLQCYTKFQGLNGIPLMIPPLENQSRVKQEIQAFWKDLYHAAYAGHAETTSSTMFLAQLDQLQKLFETREHLAVTEMPIHNLEGKIVLEVGPGAGAHSSLFCHRGARMIAMDLTLDRVISTVQKFDLIPSPHKSMALQGDAENMPFPDNTFDIVYSNGVLHHTPRTDKAIEEVFRVLKPGGKAIIMLYAKYSYLYIINILLFRGILLGNIFRKGNWVGRVTEWMSNSKQTVYNPETKVYTATEIRKLFHQYSDINIRKGSFVFLHLPFIGKLISKILGLTTGYNQAGTLVYDHAWRNETRLELWLGSKIGFNLNIVATKEPKN